MNVKAPDTEHTVYSLIHKLSYPIVVGGLQDLPACPSKQYMRNIGDLRYSCSFRTLIIRV